MQNKASALPATSCLEMIWPGHLNAFPSDLLSNSSFSTLIDNAKVHTSPVLDAVVAEYLFPGVIGPNQDLPSLNLPLPYRP